MCSSCALVIVISFLPRGVADWVYLDGSPQVVFWMQLVITRLAKECDLPAPKETALWNLGENTSSALRGLSRDVF